MNRMTTNGRQAFTLTELLVVIVIISILSTIALPVYVSNIHKAKVATAQAEVRELALAQEQVAMIHGFYVPLQLLDNIPGGQGVSGIDSNADAIGNEPTSINLIDPFKRVDQLDLNQPTLADANTNARVDQLLRNWEGPFMSFQRTFIGDSATRDPDQINPTLIRFDHPMDPWGQPYRFYTPIGITGDSPSGSDTTNQWGSNTFSDGRVTRLDDRFDRFAIVSFGPDLVPGNFQGNLSDDIFYEFGPYNIPRTETGFTVNPLPRR